MVEATVTKTRNIESVLVLGVSGQDGWYLTRMLTGRGIRVTGFSRSVLDASALEGRDPSLFRMFPGDVLDREAITVVIDESNPDVIVNFAGYTHVGDSWHHQQASRDVNVGVVKNLAHALRQLYGPSRNWPFIYHASSSEVFGATAEVPQAETTPFSPMTPYGHHKVEAHQLLHDLRADGAPVSVGIAYNHESPRRPERFVTRRISLGVARLAHGRDRRLELGALDAARDWSYAGDYVAAVAAILDTRLAEDFVISSGVQRTVRDFVAGALDVAGLSERWDLISVDSSLVRQSDPRVLVGDSRRIRDQLGWEPSVSFTELIEKMVLSDLNRLARDE